MQRQVDERELILFASLGLPVQRMVILRTWYSEGKIETEVLPVVAIQVSKVRTYGRWSDKSKISNFTGPHADLKEKGWQPLSEGLMHTCLIVDEDHGLCDYREIEGTMSTPIICMWPLEEDGVMLKVLIKEQEKEVLKCHSKKLPVPIAKSQT